MKINKSEISKSTIEPYRKPHAAMVILKGLQFVRYSFYRDVLNVSCVNYNNNGDPDIIDDYYTMDIDTNEILNRKFIWRKKL